VTGPHPWLWQEDAGIPGPALPQETAPKSHLIIAAQLLFPKADLTNAVPKQS